MIPNGYPVKFVASELDTMILALENLIGSLNVLYPKSDDEKEMLATAVKTKAKLLEIENRKFSKMWRIADASSYNKKDTSEKENKKGKKDTSEKENKKGKKEKPKTADETNTKKTRRPF